MNPEEREKVVQRLVMELLQQRGWVTATDVDEIRAMVEAECGEADTDEGVRLAVAV